MFTTYSLFYRNYLNRGSPNDGSRTAYSPQTTFIRPTNKKKVKTKNLLYNIYVIVLYYNKTNFDGPRNIFGLLMWPFENIN